MEFLVGVIVFICGIHVLINSAVILGAYSTDITKVFGIDTSEQTKFYIRNFTSFIIAPLLFIIFIFISCYVFKNFYFIPIIALSLYFIFGNNVK